MKGLLITDRLHWHDNWSSHLGKTMDIRDSSYNLLIFGEKQPIEPLKSFLKKVPGNIYRLLELEPADEGSCEIMGDSGRCYRIR